MDARTIMKIKPELTRFLHQFDHCFGRVTTRRYLDLYVEGQLSDLPRKSIEPMADAVGEPPRNLQEFLGLFRWDEPGVRDDLQQYVGRRHAHPQSVGIFVVGYSPEPIMSFCSFFRLSLRSVEGFDFFSGQGVAVDVDVVD